MLGKHLDAAPHSRYVATENVSLCRLDDIASKYLTPDSRVFLKIDTQGYESQVLDGASVLLDRLVGVQLELSLVPLYAGQPLCDQLIRRLFDAGFAMKTLWPGFRDRATGELLQFDAMFFREQEVDVSP